MLLHFINFFLAVISLLGNLFDLLLRFDDVSVTLRNIGFHFGDVSFLLI